MRTAIIPLTGMLLGGVVAVQAQRFSADYLITTEGIGLPGGAMASTDYATDTAVGGVVDLSTHSVSITRHGYVAQLYDVAGVALSATPQNVDEGATRQVSASVLLDDDTHLTLASDDPHWTVAGWPLDAISAHGEVTAGIVYQDTNGVVQGTYQGSTGMVALTVLNTNDDDYAGFAADGLPDFWQVAYFGTNNPTDAAPGADPDFDGGDNTYEYVTGTHPSNNTELFSITAVEHVSGIATQMDVSFDPVFGDRDYEVFSSASLTGGTWVALSAATETNVGSTRTVRDLNATNASAFYNVNITFSP